MERKKRRRRKKKGADVGEKRKRTYLCTLWCNAAELNSQQPLGSDWPDVGGLGR